MDKTEYESGETEEERLERLSSFEHIIAPERDARYTKEGLPIVTESTRRALHRELMRDCKTGTDQRQRINEWIEGLYKENPEIADFIGHALSVCPPEVRMTTCSALLEVYELLKMQANNNKIYDYFNGE